MDVDVLVYDGFDELDAIGPYEVFEYAMRYAAEAGQDGAEGRVRYVTLTDRDAVTASHGTRIGSDGRLPDPGDDDAPDLLVVPGGGWSARDEEASACVTARRPSRTPLSASSIAPVQTVAIRTPAS